MDAIKNGVRTFFRVAYVGPDKRKFHRKDPYHVGPAFDAVVIGSCLILAALYFAA